MLIIIIFWIRYLFELIRILYADIVNFTPLSEKFTPPELVQILNKLFGKFDQLAQVFIAFSYSQLICISRNVIVCESKF